jgi:non-specific serine/threonine protein kinase/serine/threonine-protein kinase
LKPGNIVISSEGTPHLINFSGAKLVHDELGHHSGCEGSAEVTSAGEAVQINEYSSPEQVTGEAITTASDIYSLGVILYELVTGRKPYYLKTGDSTELLQAICEQAPERPSRAAAIQASSSGQPTRKLSADLDSIILTAMRKEPERRYRSADHIACDLERYLEGSPVHAHRGSLIYQATKFVRRHVITTVVIGTLILALITGLGASVTVLGIVRRARDHALDSSRQGRQAVDQLFTKVNKERVFNQPGLQPLRNSLLENIQRFYKDLLIERRGDRAHSVELALARTRVAQISSMIGTTTEAVGQFEQAVTLWENLVSTQPANGSYREELARALNEQGMVLMRMKGRSAEALRVFQRALEAIEPQKAASHSPVASHELGMVLLNLGAVQKELGQSAEAIKSLQRSLAIEAELSAQNPDSLDSSIAMAKGHALLGQVYLEEFEKVEPALAEYEQAILLLKKVTGLHPELPEQALELAWLFGDLNRIQQVVGKLDSARESIAKALAILERLDRQYPSVLDYERALAGTCQMMSDLHYKRRELSEALEFAQKNEALSKRLVENHPGQVSLRLDLAQSLNLLGRILQQSGEPVEALRSFQRAIDIYESMPELDARGRYLLACNIALSVRLVGVKSGSSDTIDPLKLSKADQLRRQRYSSRAIELLRGTAREGTLDPDVLQSDTDLDPLRERPEFEAFVNEVRAKTTNVKQ